MRNPAALPDPLVTESSIVPDWPIEYSVFGNWQSWVDARQLYEKVNVPVTLIYSAEDWSKPDERARNRIVLSPDRFKVIEGAGHFASLERPEEVASMILQ